MNDLRFDGNVLDNLMQLNRVISFILYREHIDKRKENHIKLSEKPKMRLQQHHQ